MSDLVRPTLVIVNLVFALFLGSIDADTPPSVRFPEQVIPSPMPTPMPVGVLTSDRVYVIDSDVDGFLLTRPSGLVAVSQDIGPIRIRGKFVDGAGKVETRTFKGKVVFTLEAVGTGILYIDFVPQGIKLQTDVVSRTVNVDAGQGPQPPPPDPKPPVPPDPKPPKPPDPPTPSTSPFPGEGLRVLVVYESADLTKYPQAQLSIMTGLKSTAFLNTKCAVGPDGKTREWRMYDKDVDTSRDFPVWRDAMKRPRTSIPWLLVGNGKTGYEGPLSANTDDFITLVSKYVI